MRLNKMRTCLNKMRTCLKKADIAKVRILVRGLSIALKKF